MPDQLIFTDLTKPTKKYVLDMTTALRFLEAGPASRLFLDTYLKGNFFVAAATLDDLADSKTTGAHTGKHQKFDYLEMRFRQLIERGTFGITQQLTNGYAPIAKSVGGELERRSGRPNRSGAFSITTAFDTNSGLASDDVYVRSVIQNGSDVKELRPQRSFNTTDSHGLIMGWVTSGGDPEIAYRVYREQLALSGVPERPTLERFTTICLHMSQLLPILNVPVDMRRSEQFPNIDGLFQLPALDGWHALTNHANALSSDNQNTLDAALDAVVRSTQGDRPLSGNIRLWPMPESNTAFLLVVNAVSKNQILAVVEPVERQLVVAGVLNGQDIKNREAAGALRREGDLFKLMNDSFYVLQHMRAELASEPTAPNQDGTALLKTQPEPERNRMFRTIDTNDYDATNRPVEVAPNARFTFRTNNGLLARTSALAIANHCSEAQMILRLTTLGLNEFIDADPTTRRILANDRPNDGPQREMSANESVGKALRRTVDMIAVALNRSTYRLSTYALTGLIQLGIETAERDPSVLDNVSIPTEKFMHFAETGQRLADPELAAVSPITSSSPPAGAAAGKRSDRVTPASIPPRRLSTRSAPLKPEIVDNRRPLLTPREALTALELAVEKALESVNPEHVAKTHADSQKQLAELMGVAAEAARSGDVQTLAATTKTAVEVSNRVTALEAWGESGEILTLPDVLGNGVAALRRVVDALDPLTEVTGGAGGTLAIA